MAPREKSEEPMEPEDCLHQGRPQIPREDSKIWHCEVCDTSFAVSEHTVRVWREL